MTRKPGEYNIFVNISKLGDVCGLSEAGTYWLGQKLKRHGHNKQWPENLVNTTSHNPMKEFYHG